MALKQRQITQRWVKTATATEKSANTIVKYQQGHGFLLNNVKRQVLNFKKWKGK